MIHGDTYKDFSHRCLYGPCMERKTWQVASVLKVISVQVDKRGEIVYTGFQQGNRKMIFP